MVTMISFTVYAFVCDTNHTANAESLEMIAESGREMNIFIGNKDKIAKPIGWFSKCSIKNEDIKP